MAGLSKILDGVRHGDPGVGHVHRAGPEDLPGDTDQILADRVQAAVTQKGLPLRYQIRADEGSR